jgi:calcium/calmodulin-dependent protein kinase I
MFPLPKVAPHVRVENLSDLYEMGDFIAAGGFSKVYRATHKKTGEERAIKVTDKAILTGKRATMVARETEILRRCSHPNILRLYEVVETPTLLCLVMELVTGGDLYDYIVKRRSLTEEEAAKIAKGILLAVEYLHGATPPVVHRDIKPENVLIQDVDKGKVMLSDFGLSKILMDSKMVECTPGGTSFYLPPEIIEGIKKHGAHPRPSNIQDMKSLDLWSTGIVLYILLCGSPPFKGSIRGQAERQKLLDQINQGVQFPENKWKDVSEEAKDLVRGLLQIEPTRRYPVRVALQHPWIMTGGGGIQNQLRTPSVLASEYKDKADFHQSVAAAAAMRPGEPPQSTIVEGAHPAVHSPPQHHHGAAASSASSGSTTPPPVDAKKKEKTLNKPGASALLKNRLFGRKDKDKDKEGK